MTINKYELNAKQLIQLKEKRLETIQTAYIELLNKEEQIKNIENNLYLKTDFKELGLTNEKMRTAYVNDTLIPERTDLLFLKFELKQQENSLVILNDLIKLKLMEMEAE